MQTPAYGAFGEPPPMPPEPPKKRSPLPYILIPLGACFGLALLLVVAGLIIGPSEDDTEDAATSGPTSTTETAVEETTTTEAPTTTAAPTTTSTTAPATTTTAAPTTTTAPPPTTAPPTTAPPTTAAPAIMPNVVCMVLQDAQDTIQAAGVFFSRSEDATGQNRSQVIDSNWIVVGQTPAPGTPVGELEAVLSAVKIGEPSPC